MILVIFFLYIDFISMGPFNNDQLVFPKKVQPPQQRPSPPLPPAVSLIAAPKDAVTIPAAAPHHPSA